MKKCPFCAEEIQDAAIVCKHCGRDLVPSPQPRTQQSAAIPAPQGHRIVVVVGCVMIIWGILVGVAGAIGGRPSGAVAFLFIIYGVVLIQRDRRAMGLTWFVLLLFGLSVLLGGLVPLNVILWVALLWFAIYLRKHRTLLKA